MEDDNNIGKSGFLQAMSLAVIAAVAVVTASLDSMLTRLGLGGTAALLVLATLCLFGAAMRVVPPGDYFGKRKRSLLLFILLIHLLALCLFFPPDEVVNDKPVVTLDHSIHYYQIVRSREVLWNYATVHSYDPSFMAGYPAGALFDIDMKGAELFCAALRPLDSARAMKFYILLCYATLVLSLYRGSRLLGFSSAESILGVLLCLSFWHAGRPYAGAFRFAGMFSFIFVTHLSLYVIGLFRQFVRSGAIGWFFIVGPLAFLVHPTALVMMPFAFMAIIALEMRYLNWSRVGLFFIWCLIVVGVNAVWLVPLLRYLDLKLPTETFFQLTGMFEAAEQIAKPGSVPALGMVVLAGAGLVKLTREKRFSVALPVGVAALFLLMIASYGCRMICIDQMEPGRFLYSFLIFLAPLAGAGLYGCINRASRRFARARTRIEYGIVMVLLLAPIWLSFVESRTFYEHRINTRVPTEVAALVQITKDRSEMRGRLMVEDGPASLYRNAHLPGMLPLMSGREQIGGPYPYTFVPHHYAAFQRDKTFGKELAAHPPAEFRIRLEEYNVRWILTASEETRSYIGTVPSVGLVKSMGRYSLWIVEGDFGPVFNSNAGVTAEQNRIYVNFREPPVRVVLKYHWDRGLTAEPPAKIFPVRHGDDPVPFIGLDPHGMREVTIFYD
jgi:hypothetical protein